MAEINTRLQRTPHATILSSRISTTWSSFSLSSLLGCRLLLPLVSLSRKLFLLRLSLSPHIAKPLCPLNAQSKSTTTTHYYYGKKRDATVGRFPAVLSAACTARSTRFSGRISVSIIRGERETKRDWKNKRRKEKKKCEHRSRSCRSDGNLCQKLFAPNSRLYYGRITSTVYYTGTTTTVERAPPSLLFA